MRTKNKTVKSKKHLNWVGTNHCCILCSHSEVQVAHIRHLPSGNLGVGRKDDRYCVPLCYKCHALQHTMNEREFWKKYKINPLEFSYELCKNSPCSKVKKFNETTNYFREGKYEQQERICSTT